MVFLSVEGLIVPEKSQSQLPIICISTRKQHFNYDTIKSMNISPCTPDETEGFEHISDFVYPDGQLDEQALSLFLSAYQTQPESSRYYYSSNSDPKRTQKQIPAMGLLLRLLDTTTPLWFETFQVWYSLHRMDNEAYMQAWFSFLDNPHKEMTKTAMLRMLAGAPPIEIRVALMMDGMEHYRELPVQTFIGKSLLRVKSASFVKALKPRVAQMPMVLSMAKELKETAPEFSELAQAITMGVFVQRMSEKPSYSNKQSEYSACEAILIVLDHGVIPETPLFVKSAKSRFKGSSLLSDMMQFVSWALEPDPSKNWMMRTPLENEKTFAASLMTALLDDILLQPASNASYDYALTQAHAVLPADEEVYAKMRTWFFQRLSEKKGSALSTSTFVYLLDHLVNADQRDALWQGWCKLKDKNNVQELLQHYVEKGQDYYDPERYYELMRNVLSAQDIVNVLYNHAPLVFDAETVMSKHSTGNNQSDADKQKSRELHFLGGVEQFFGRARNLVSPEVRQNQSFKQLVAATSMAYLLHASQSSHAKYNERNGLFVNLLAEPLPLLRSMYPEHTAALNALRKDIIGRKNKYHGALYNVLGKALYSNEASNMDTVVGLTQTMGVSVFSYFQACTMQQDVHFEVSSDIFEAAMY